MSGQYRGASGAASSLLSESPAVRLPPTPPVTAASDGLFFFPADETPNGFPGVTSGASSASAGLPPSSALWAIGTASCLSKMTASNASGGAQKADIQLGAARFGTVGWSSTRLRRRRRDREATWTT